MQTKMLLLALIGRELCMLASSFAMRLVRSLSDGEKGFTERISFLKVNP